MFTAQTEWTCPDHFPDLSKYKYVSIDLETRDPNLKTRGSGAVIGEGEIIGVAFAGMCHSISSSYLGRLSRKPESDRRRSLLGVHSSSRFPLVFPRTGYACLAP